MDRAVPAPLTATRHAPGRRVSMAHRVDVLRIALFIFIVVSISTVQAYFGILRALRLGLLMWALSLAAVLLLPERVRWSNVMAAWPPRAVILLTVITCLSAPFGLSTGASGAYFISAYGRILLFFFMLIVALRGVSDIRFFTWAFVISAATLALLSLTIMGTIVTFGGGMRLAATNMYDANDLGLIFVMAVPLTLLLFQTSTGPLRLLAVVCGATIVLGIATTGSRGAFVGLAVITPALFLAMSDVSVEKRLGIIAILVVGLALGAPEGYWDRIATIFSLSEDYNLTSDAGRVEIAKRGLGYMWQYPAFGVGLANFGRAEGTISEMARNAMFGDQILVLAPHNTYVQVGAELGVFALLLWISLIWTGTIGLWRLRARAKLWGGPVDPRSDQGFLLRSCTFLPITFLAFATVSFFVSHAYTPVFYVVVALLSGVLTFYRPPVKGVGSPSILPSRRMGNGGTPPPAPVSH